MQFKGLTVAIENQFENRGAVFELINFDGKRA